MAGRGESLTGIRRVGRRLVPTDSGNRILILSLWIISGLPCGGPRPAGLIDQLRHGSFPAQFLAAFEKLLRPVFAVAVSAGICKLLVLLVGNFILVDEEIAYRPIRRIGPQHPDHARWDLPLRVQGSMDAVARAVEIAS